MHKSQAASFLVDLPRYKADGLVEAVCPGGFESGFFHLLDRVLLGSALTTAAGIAAFHLVVGDDFDVVPPGVAVEMGASLSCGESGECNG